MPNGNEKKGSFIVNGARDVRAIKIRHGGGFLNRLSEIRKFVFEEPSQNYWELPRNNLPVSEERIVELDTGKFRKDRTVKTVQKRFLGRSLKVTRYSASVQFPKVHQPPGSRIRATLQFVFTKKAFETVFAQAIVDMRDEHAEALSEGRMHKARWIVARDHFGLGLTVAAYLAATVGKKIMGVWSMIPPGGD